MKKNLKYIIVLLIGLAFVFRQELHDLLMPPKTVKNNNTSDAVVLDTDASAAGSLDSLNGSDIMNVKPAPAIVQIAPNVEPTTLTGSNNSGITRVR